MGMPQLPLVLDNWCSIHDKNWIEPYPLNTISIFLPETSREPVVVAGVDVGGRRKGFYAVAYRGRECVGKFQSSDATAVAEWSREVGARLVGIDAPCRWSATGRARPAERELMAGKISCFSSPTLEAALAHPKEYFHWMLAGADLFAALETTHRLYTGGPVTEEEAVCFETFPHAVVCALAGEIVPAKSKRVSRRQALRDQGVEESPLTNIDSIDAALCALTATALWNGQVTVYGEAATGLIVVPVGKAVS